MTDFSPSIIAADLLHLQEEIERVKEAKYLHLDIMDGHYVPNITIGPLFVKALKGKSQHLLDVHLMIERPEKYLETFIEAGAHLLTIHVETTPHLHRYITLIKEAGVMAGVALNPHTPLSSIMEMIHLLDLVLIMSVNPGFSGQVFIPQTLQKIRDLRQIICDKRLETLIQVDGGIDPVTAPEVVEAGADILVAGSYIFQEGQGDRALARLRESVE